MIHTIFRLACMVADWLVTDLSALWPHKCPHKWKVKLYTISYNGATIEVCEICKTVKRTVRS
jgi:hypothetical protein